MLSSPFKPSAHSNAQIIARPSAADASGRQPCLPVRSATSEVATIAFAETLPSREMQLRNSSPLAARSRVGCARRMILPAWLCALSASAHRAANMHARSHAMPRGGVVCTCRAPPTRRCALGASGKPMLFRARGRGSNLLSWLSLGNVNGALRFTVVAR